MTYRSLATIRRTTPMTQAQVAAGMGISRSKVSEIEHTALHDLDLVTIASYLDVFGARLEVVAVLAHGHRVVLGRSVQP